MKVNRKSFKFTFFYLVWLVAAIVAVSLISCNPRNAEESASEALWNVPTALEQLNSYDELFLNLDDEAKRDLATIKTRSYSLGDLVACHYDKPETLRVILKYSKMRGAQF